MATDDDRWRKQVLLMVAGVAAWVIVAPLLLICLFFQGCFPGSID